MVLTTISFEARRYKTPISWLLMYKDQLVFISVLGKKVAKYCQLKRDGEDIEGHEGDAPWRSSVRSGITLSTRDFVASCPNSYQEVGFSRG